MTRTTNKNVAVQKGGHLLASSQARALLPDVLIEYLWKHVLNEGWCAFKEQFFVLKPGKLGGRGIQEIYHVCGNDGSTDVRRVYGVEPVECMLQVLHSQGDYQMQLCASL